MSHQLQLQLHQQQSSEQHCSLGGLDENKKEQETLKSGVLMQVTEWAAQVAEVLREEVGAEALAAAMNVARGAISTSKAKRKRAVALQAVVDPEAAAQRRLRRNEKRSGERKRKAVVEKRQRDAGVARGGGKRGSQGDGGADSGNKKHKRRER